MLLLLIKHGCTTMNLREKQNIEQTVGAQRKPIANGKRNFTSEEGVVSNILPLQWNHAAKAVPRREGCHWEILHSLCCLRLTLFTREYHPALNCMVSQFSMIVIHPLTSRSQVQEYLLDLSCPMTLVPCDRHLLVHLQKRLAGRRFHRIIPRSSCFTLSFT